MPIDFGHHGLNYTHDLCKAIEQYTAREVEKNPEAFKYRDIQLRYAVERWLYIQCINSEALFQHYLTHQFGIFTHSKLSAMNDFESDVALFLPNTKLPKKQLAKRRVLWLLKITKRTISWLIYRLKKRKEAKSISLQSEVLFHIVNVKFARYLEPITGLLAHETYAFLNTNDVQLGKKLSKSGYSVINYFSENTDTKPYFSLALSEFTQLIRYTDSLLVALRETKPACVVVVEGNAPSDAITAEICHLLNIPCFCIQHGWSPYSHNGFRNMNFTEMFVWGPQFAELLRPYNPKQTFRVTGTHNAKRNHLTSTRERIETLSFFLQAPCALLGFKAYKEFVDLTLEVARAHPEIKVIVRSHLSYSIPHELQKKLIACHNIYLSNPATEPVTDVIVTSDLVISVFSTVLLEAMGMGVAPLICSIGAMREYEPDIASTGAAIEVHSIAEARRTIDNLIATPERLVEVKNCIRQISKNYFINEDGAKVIVRLLQSATNVGNLQR